MQSVFSIQNIQIRVNGHNFPPIKDIQIQVAVRLSMLTQIYNSEITLHGSSSLNYKPFIALRIYWIGVADVHGIFIFTVVAVDTMVW